MTELVVHKRKLVATNNVGKDIFINLCEFGPIGRKPGYIKSDGEVNCKECLKISGKK